MIKQTKYIAAALLAVGILSLSQRAFAGSTATQTVSFEVQPIDELSVSGSPSLVINSATAGGAPVSATANATYAISTNQSDRKITAELDSDMPSGVTLDANVAAPNGASSTGAQSLSTTPVDVVTGISTLNESGKNISYTLSATTAAGVVPAASRTVTYTITAGS
jgi:hypothetical protein